VSGRKGERERERDIIDDRLFRIHFIAGMIEWTGLAPWAFEFSFPGSLSFTALHTSLEARSLRSTPPCPAIIRGVEFCSARTLTALHTFAVELSLLNQYPRKDLREGLLL